MPLAFRSLSHGTIAFGFFNVESDMLLLQHLFFFADRFCAAVVALAEQEGLAAPGEGGRGLSLAGWRIEDPAAIGDLGGAISGTALSGLIGATYREFPFPARPEQFRQAPEGARTQGVIGRMADQFGRAEEIPLRWNRATGTVALGEFVFTEAMFGLLVGYVERGGMPRWRDETPPDYVRAMAARLAQLRSPLRPAPA